MALSRITAVALFVGVAAAVASCISDRSSGPRFDPAGCNVQLPSEAFGSTIVIIRDFAFTPALVNVRAGTKVTWVNCDPTGTNSHTSTSDAPGWDSPLLAPAQTYTREFSTAGSFPYHCAPHPSMQGTVTVN